MKNFKIDENQLQQLWNTLVEFPAKNVMIALDMIRSLPVLEEVVEEKKPD